MATEKIWVWKHLLHPCLGSYLSSLDRKGSFLTCPQPPCGPGQCSCFTLENSRQQQAPGIKQLSLSCHGFWLSPRRQSGTSLPHAKSEQSCDPILKSTGKGELPQLGKLRADWHARPWSTTDTSMALTANERSLDDSISLSRDTLITTLL